MSLPRLPYWRLSAFYFFYFAVLGILLPYWSLYLKWQGFSAREIGELTAILLAARILAPNLWGWIADHRGQRIHLIRIASLLAVISFAGIFLHQSYLWVALVLLLFSFFWNGSLPQFEATTLQHLGEQSHYYTKIRAWGSIGFIVSVLVVGYLLDFFSTSLVPIAMLISLTGIWLVSQIVPEPAAHPQRLPHIPLTTLLKRTDVIAFLSICFLVQFSHGPYYTFYTIYLKQYDYGPGLIGELWALAVAAEVIIFLFMHRWLPRFGIRRVLLTSALLSSLRWLLIGLFPQNMALIIFAQLLHAASYGTYHAAAIAWVHQHFTGRNQGRGQALYSSVSFGVGGAMGSLLSGYLWSSAGSTITFVIAAIACIIAFFIGFLWLQDQPSLAS